jgi:hypothetical protein
MHDAHTVGKSRYIGTLISFAVFVIVSWIFEHMADRDAFESALGIQHRWLAVVSAMSPLELAATFTAETWRITQHCLESCSTADLLLWPLRGLINTAHRVWHASAWFSLLQLVLGSVAVATFNMQRSGGKHIYFEIDRSNNFWLNAFLIPLAIIGAASVVAFILKIVMLAALYAPSWITGLASAAAGASGVVGFCWYCAQKLGEKSAEHALIQNIKI